MNLIRGRPSFSRREWNWAAVLCRSGTGESRVFGYLWYGIGAFLAKNPRFRYLFGAVSISSTLPPLARELLVYFYKLKEQKRKRYIEDTILL